MTKQQGKRTEQPPKREHIAWLIYWDEDAQDSYVCGSSIDFAWDGTVVFANEGMPPGCVIREWRSYTDCSRQKAESRLPILEEGKSYYLQVLKQDEPEGGSFVRATYYDRKGDLVGFELLRENVNRMTYPKGAFQYTLQLVQGGAARVRFCRMELVSEEDWEDWKSCKAAERETGHMRTCRW